MYLRWKKGPSGSRSAVLVAAVRTEAGPRQRHIAYLGSIMVRHEKSRANAVKFWESADRALAAADIPEAERARVAGELEAKVPRPAPARKPSSPKFRDGSSFADRLPSRPDRDEESLRYLDSPALHQLMESTRFDDDASLYHAIKPLMDQIQEIKVRSVRLRTTESMGPFYRRVYDMLSVWAPEAWKACSGCAARNHKDGTCRKCKGCRYLIKTK
jgi:hypothetical protein